MVIACLFGVPFLLLVPAKPYTKGIHNYFSRVAWVCAASNLSLESILTLFTGPHCQLVLSIDRIACLGTPYGLVLCCRTRCCNTGTAKCRSSRAVLPTRLLSRSWCPFLSPNLNGINRDTPIKICKLIQDELQGGGGGNFIRREFTHLFFVYVLPL